MIKIDLHVHSTVSDGTLSPTQVVETAHKKGISIMALTDHDTVDGVPEFLRACRRRNIRPIVGIELSADAPVTTHILGYRIVDLEIIHDAMRDIVQKREKRNRKICELLNSQGIDIGYDDVVAEASGKIVARPHFASLLVKRGVCPDRRIAFSRYLARGGLAYVKRESLVAKECIDLISRAGGVASLAHPSLTGLEGSDLDDMIEELKSFGLWGLECLSSHCTFAETLRFMEVAGRHHLAVTGGSDFHGSNRPWAVMGICVTPDLLPWARLGVTL